MKRSTLVAALVALVVPVAGIVAVIPLLAFGMGADSPSASCVTAGSAPSEVGPTILGSSVVDRRSIMDWWFAAGRRQPPRLGRAVDEVAALYLSEGEAEGVRGDLALVQAIYETGWFTNGDTARNNFAGIAHPDGAAAGRAFPDVATGVRGHVQLLKKYAAGNDTTLAHPDVAPDAGAQATRWDQLAGTWASAPDYWARISTVYRSLLTAAGRGSSTACSPALPSGAEEGYTGTPGDVPLTTVEGITVHTEIADHVAALVQAARADGVALAGTGYRSPERQIELRRAHCGTTDYAVYEMPSSQCSPPTARPGNSNHERGLAIDFTCNGGSVTRSSECFQWLSAHAGAFGLHNLPSESWHWSVDGT